MSRRSIGVLCLGGAIAAGAGWAWWRPARAASPAELLEAIPLTTGSSETDKSLALWAARARQGPHSLLAWTNLGDVLMQKARETMDVTYYGRAETAFRRALEISPDNTAAMTGIAWVHGSRHEFNQSIDWARKALASEPKSHEAYGLLGDAAIELGDYEAAFKHYQKMLDIRPDLSSYSRGAHLLFLTGDTRKAIWLMEKAIAAGAAHAENTAWCRAQLALMLWHTGALLAAEQTAEAGLVRAPGNFHLLSAMGRIKTAKGDFISAIEYYKRASATAPHHDVVVALGDLYALSGRHDEAQKQYALVEAVHEANRGNGVKGRVELARFYADHDRKLEEALAIAEQEYKEWPNPVVADTLAWCYYKNGRYEDARRVIAEALEPGTTDASILFHAGMIHEKLGQRSAAQQFLYRAVNLNPNFHPVYAKVATDMLTRLGS
jgi:tetratricopeptide (TPR) repeat protein